MRVLDLFSGIGGFSLGLEHAGMQTVAFCEINPFCQKVLRKHWPDVPIYPDIKTLDYAGSVDLICGGYPCQPFSVAGKREGKKDDRHLWPAMFDCIKKYRPSWVIGENVVGHISMGLDDVLSDLESEDYETIPFVIPACAIGAPHRRDRVWILAYNGSQRVQRIIKKTLQRKSSFSWCQDIRRVEDYFNRSDIPQPLILGSHDGIPNWMDRLKSLGNAVVPQVPEIIGHLIMQIEQNQLKSVKKC